MIDLGADIVPGRAAAGLALGDSIVPLRHLGRALAVHESCREAEILDLGPVQVWATGGLIEQILVRGEYAGRIARTDVRIESPLGQFVHEVGALIEDDDNVLLFPAVPGISMETTAWSGPDRESIDANLNSTITDRWMFDPTSASEHAARGRWTTLGGLEFSEVRAVDTIGDDTDAEQRRGARAGRLGPRSQADRSRPTTGWQCQPIRLCLSLSATETAWKRPVAGIPRHNSWEWAWHHH